MRDKTQATLICFLLSFVLLCGCEKPRPPITKLSAAQEYFLKICREEIKIDAKVFPVGKSVWIYVPMETNIFDIKAAAKDATPKAETKTKWSIQFLETLFANDAFTVSYDIEEIRIYDRPVTYQNKFADEYSRIQREILTALTRAYFDVGATTVSVPVTVGTDKQPEPEMPKVLKRPNIPEETPPEFFVMVFADTKRGVAMKAVNYFADIRMAMSNPPAITNEEYSLRYIYELYGDEALIGDKDGNSLHLEEIKLGDFLAKQIDNRIKTKFVQSSFPPTDEAKDAIWGIIADTLRLYNFKNFQNIKLIDLKNQTEALYDKNQL